MKGVGRTGTRGLGTLALIVSLAVSTWTHAPLQAATAEAVTDPLSHATYLSATLVRPDPDILDALLGGSGTGVDGPRLRASDLDAAVAYAAGRPQVGLAVLDRATGTYLDNGAGAQIPMGSASIVKVLIADELLHRASLGQVALGPSEYARIEAMLVVSDDAAASSLYTQFGDVGLIAAALTRHGMSQSTPPADSRYWGNTKVSAHDLARFYDSVLDSSLPATSRDYLFGLLRRIAPVAADGFGQLFGIAGMPMAAGAAVKQGWMCCLDGVRNVHSTAVVGADDRYVVVILTQFSPTLPWSYGQTTTTDVAGLVLAALPSSD